MKRNIIIVFCFLFIVIITANLFFHQRKKNISQEVNKKEEISQAAKKIQKIKERSQAEIAKAKKKSEEITKTENYQACLDIQDRYYRFNCITKIALKLKNIEICDNLKAEDLRNNCRKILETNK